MRRLLVADLLHHPDALAAAQGKRELSRVYRWNILREGD